MLQTLKTVQEFLFQTRGSRREIRIVRATVNSAALPPEFRKAELGELRGLAQVLDITLEVDGQLLASLNAALGIGNDFLPDFRRARVFTLLSGHQGKFALRFGFEFRRQSNFQGLRARRLRAIGVPAPEQESGKPEEVQTFVRGAWCLGKKLVDLAEKRGKSAQIHLIVAHYRRKRLGGPAAQVVEIKLRNERGRNVILAMPAQPRRIQDAAFEIHEPHRTEPELPQRARR